MSMTLGQQLQRKRKERGYSLEQIAEMTRIPILTLQNIEASDYSLLPAKPFARGFIRTYAKIVGLEPNAAVAQFDQEASGTEDVSPVSKPPPNLVVDPPAEDKESVLWFQASKTFFMLIGLIMTATLCGIIFFALEKFSSYDQEKEVTEDVVKEKAPAPEDELYVTPSLPQDTDIVPEPSTQPEREDSSPPETSEAEPNEALKTSQQQSVNTLKKKSLKTTTSSSSRLQKVSSVKPHKISIHAFQNVKLTIVWSVGSPQSFQLKPNEIKNIIFSSPVKLRMDNGSAVKVIYDGVPRTTSDRQEPIELSFP